MSARKAASPYGILLIASGALLRDARHIHASFSVPQGRQLRRRRRKHVRNALAERLEGDVGQKEGACHTSEN